MNERWNVSIGLSANWTEGGDGFYTSNNIANAEVLSSSAWGSSEEGEEAIHASGIPKSHDTSITESRHCASSSMASGAENEAV